jgi:hypothetical protein
MKQITSIIFLIVALQSYGFAAAYYVDQYHPSSDDTNPGSRMLPFKTIQRGVDLAQAGDSVIIIGVPSEELAEYPVEGNGISTSSSGSEGKFIVITAFPGHKVVLKGTGASGYGIDLNHSYLHFYGLKFSGFRKAVEGTSTKSNIIFENCEFTNTSETGLRLRNIHGLIMRDCYVHHCFEAGISLRGSSNCLFERVESSFNSDGLGEAGDGDGFHSLDGDSINFIDCVARNNSEDGFDLSSNGVLINCISSGHIACNIKLWRRDTDNYLPKTMTIINALIYDAGQCGIKITNGPRLRLFCSVISENGEEGIAFRGISIANGPEVVESVLINNIISGNSSKADWARGVDVKQSGPNLNQVSASYNLYYNNKNPNSGLFTDSDAINGKDPSFMDAGDGDFHLNADSPAINSGISQEVYQSLYTQYEVDLSADFDRQPRPYEEKWDIGPFEYSQPTGLEIKSTKKPSVYGLHNYPNPFNPATTIQFDLPGQSHVILEICDVTGQEIIKLLDGSYHAGTHLAVWNGKDDEKRAVSSGIYYYRLIAEEQVLTGKMILLR